MFTRRQEVLTTRTFSRRPRARATSCPSERASSTAAFASSAHPSAPTRPTSPSRSCTSLPPMMARHLMIPSAASDARQQPSQSLLGPVVGRRDRHHVEPAVGERGNERRRVARRIGQHDIPAVTLQELGHHAEAEGVLLPRNGPDQRPAPAARFGHAAEVRPQAVGDVLEAGDGERDIDEGAAILDPERPEPPRRCGQYFEANLLRRHPPLQQPPHALLCLLIRPSTPSAGRPRESPPRHPPGSACSAGGGGSPPGQRPGRAGNAGRHHGRHRGIVAEKEIRHGTPS